MRSSPLSNTAVVIPCYKAAGSIRAVVAEVPEGIGRIYCVNDASPDNLAEVLTRCEYPPAHSDPPRAASSHCEFQRRIAEWSVLPHLLRVQRAIVGSASAASC